jgi:hypothetical protein
MSKLYFEHLRKRLVTAGAPPNGMKKEIYRVWVKNPEAHLGLMKSGVKCIQILVVLSIQ